MSNSKNINSFADNMSKTITALTNTLNLLTSILLSMTTNESFVTYDYTNTKGETVQYELPSYMTLINRIKALEESINALSNGRGSISLADGSRRLVKLSNIPETPALITTLEDPTTFSIDSNWFFEDLMFPGATVKIDLTTLIPNDADRVKVARIILDSRNTACQLIWNNNLSTNLYDYYALKSLLTTNNIVYSEDIETILLPLVNNTAAGIFLIIDDPEIINGQTWYTFDNIYYKTISDGIATVNNILSINDTISYSNTLYRVIDINQNNNKVRLLAISGSAIPGIYSTFNYYEEPFREKAINVRFGANEYNFIYIKAVNEDFNLLANEWSSPVKFDTNMLLYEGDNSIDFLKYYQRYIVDWGANLIADAKLKSIKALYGQIPNAPVLLDNELRVVLINTLINAAIDTAEVKNTAAEIETTKSLINSLKATIAAQKSSLLDKNVDKVEYNSIQLQILTNTIDLRNLLASYSTLVSNMKSIVKENLAVNIDPKYHIRGFFAIPDVKYQDEEKTIPEEIIGFDIAYRYICTDNTATLLNTFTYTDGTTRNTVTGTFTDWSIMLGKLKNRIFNNDTGLYEWCSENVADGTEININQIDIPITKGEKVEIKVRSISEAGFPENPLKSEWSNSVIVTFPTTLSTTNEIADLITDINDDALEITINNTLNSIGIETHMDDGIANTDSVNGLYFKHIAKYIAYENETDTGTIKSISVQEKIDNLEQRLKEAEATIGLLNDKILELTTN